MYTRMLSPTVVIAALLLGDASASSSASESHRASLPERTPRAAAKATMDVCSLLTKEEIAAVTGAVITAMVPAAYGPSQTCNYNAQGQLMPVVSLLLTPSIQRFASSTAMAEWQRAQATKGMSMGDLKVIIEPVDGLGVPATRNEIEGAGLVTVAVAAKGRVLQMTTSTLERSKALAAKAMVRLP
jgi:hypothetical protein